MRLRLSYPTLLTVLIAAACSSEGDGPALTASVDPATVKAGAEVAVSVELTNFALDPAGYGKENAAGKGHFHVYLDTVGEATMLKASAESPVQVGIPLDAAAGAHKLIITLQNNDHSPLSPAVQATVDITVQPGDPPVINAQVDKTSIAAGGEFTVSVTVQNFQLDAANYGGMAVAGHGHYHVYLDQIGDAYKLKGSAQPSQAIIMPIATTPGAHNLIIALETNNHMPVLDVGKTIAVTVTPAPPPTLSALIDNDTIEAGADFTVTVSVEYFVLDPDNYGGAPIERHGHWHVYLDQIGEAYKLKGSALAQDRVTLPANTTQGAHNLLFALETNDHQPLVPAVGQTIPITVAVLAPPPGQNVYVDGKVTKLGAYLAGNNEYVGQASVLAYGVSPAQTTLSSADAATLGDYRLSLPSNGQAMLFATKANYYPSYNSVTTQAENLVGKKIYLAENAWINAIAANHNVDLNAPFACHPPALDAATQCIYAIIVGRIVDDGAAGNGTPRPVAGIAKESFTITGATGAWYTKGPYFLDYNGLPSAELASQTYLDQATGLYKGGLFVAFVEIPQTAGSPYVDLQLSISHADAAAGVTRYFGPAALKVFRPYGVTWTTLAETGTPGGGGVPPPGNVDFDTQIYPLFLTVAQGGLGCQGCHTNQGGATPSAGMNLYGGAETAYNSLNPATYPNRVNLANPDASYLLVRPLYEANGVQDHPIFAFASSQDPAYQLIRAWIAGGAVRTVAQAPVSFANDVRPLLYNTPATGGAGCRSCHYDGVNRNNAPANFYMSNDPQELYDQLVTIAATDSDAYGEGYRINKQAYPERSLILVKPLATSTALHPVKIWSGNTDPRYQLLYRWIAEGYQNN